MMPSPEEITALVDHAERIGHGGRLMRLSREDRRRLIAWAVFEELRRERQDQREPVVVPA